MNTTSITPSIGVTIGRLTRLYYAYITTAPATLDAPATLTLYTAPITDVCELAYDEIAFDRCRARTPARLILVDTTERSHQKRMCREHRHLLAEADPFLVGLKLLGFGIWQQRNGTGHNVTFPARHFTSTASAATSRCCEPWRTAAPKTAYVSSCYGRTRRLISRTAEPRSQVGRGRLAAFEPSPSYSARKPARRSPMRDEIAIDDAINVVRVLAGERADDPDCDVSSLARAARQLLHHIDEMAFELERERARRHSLSRGDTRMPEGHALLEGTDGGGRRDFLAGRPVHAGEGLRLLTCAGWHPVRYESNVAGRQPVLYLPLPGTWQEVVFAVPREARLAWPEELRLSLR